MENELDQDLLTLKSHGTFRERRVMYGEVAHSYPRPACLLTWVGFVRSSGKAGSGRPKKGSLIVSRSITKLVFVVLVFQCTRQENKEENTLHLQQFLFSFTKWIPTGDSTLDCHIICKAVLHCQWSCGGEENPSKWNQHIILDQVVFTYITSVTPTFFLNVLITKWWLSF